MGYLQLLVIMSRSYALTHYDRLIEEDFVGFSLLNTAKNHTIYDYFTVQ